ncbi:MAG: type II toxin-antitoxin system prevent-host-death family antitoxin [Gemmatimonadetes bacterium]|nr:type II toxin-antitoxin system prevent-host-death family antitoxin [Gemmatimonadota bacterium]
MTIGDYYMTMKSVKIADLKAHLSEHLRYVRRGHVLTILDRDTPVARVIPYEAPETLTVRGPARRYAKLGGVRLPPPLPTELDVLELLAEERQSER